MESTVKIISPNPIYFITEDGLAAFKYVPLFSNELIPALTVDVFERTKAFENAKSEIVERSAAIESKNTVFVVQSLRIPIPPVPANLIAGVKVAFEYA